MKKICWGDIHNHNSIGYGLGSLERSYAIAKGCLLDFYAFTPHGYWPDAPQEDPKVKKSHEAGYQRVRAAWPEVVAAAEKHNRDGEFIALIAFEWHSSSSGDYCVYLPGKDGETFPAENLDSLKSFAAKHDALLVPHHPGYRPGERGLDWNGFDENFSPVVEGFSEHGCSIESATPWPMTGHSMGGLDRSQTLFSQLNEGRFFGLAGSTDNHFGHPASCGEGLTGLYVEELSRRGVLDALRKRRSIAVTGERIDARLAVGNAFMGEIAAPGSKDFFDYYASCFCGIEFVQIIKNGIPAHTVIPRAKCGRDKFAARVEFGWGGIKDEDVALYEAEVKVQDGVFEGISPGFCGGADSDLMNRITEFTPGKIKFEAFTSRKNITPVSSVAFRVAGDKARIFVECRFHYKGKLFERKISGSADELIRRDFWAGPGGFSSPSLKLGGYAPGEACEEGGRWMDDKMKRGDWYMLKVMQKNGHIAWTSPIKIA